MRRALLLFVLLLVSASLLPSARSEERVASDVATRTRTWLERLAPRQRGAVLHAFTAAERRNWHYVPRARAGLALRSMDERTRREILAVFAAALGPGRWKKAEAVFALEAELRRRVVARSPNAPTSWRDPLHYFVTVFGTPSADGPWGLRLEGHHLSVNLTFRGATLRAATPLFFGANPASVRTPNGGVLRPLGTEEDLAVQLVTSLDANQRRQALAGARIPSDVLFGPGRRAAPTGRGLPASAMTPAQRDVLRRLVDAHRPAGPVPDADVAVARFVWMGEMRAGGALYYRLEAPTFLVELRNLGDHVHCLWRDPRGDFGTR